MNVTLMLLGGKRGDHGLAFEWVVLSFTNLLYIYHSGHGSIGMDGRRKEDIEGGVKDGIGIYTQASMFAEMSTKPGLGSEGSGLAVGVRHIQRLRDCITPHQSTTTFKIYLHQVDAFFLTCRVVHRPIQVELCRVHEDGLNRRWHPTHATCASSQAELIEIDSPYRLSYMTWSRKTRRYLVVAFMIGSLSFHEKHWWYKAWHADQAEIALAPFHLLRD